MAISHSAPMSISFLIQQLQLLVKVLVIRISQTAP